MNLIVRRNIHWLSAAAVILSMTAVTLEACTVFVMTDGRQTLFCNNEDFSNPNTRIWFIPAAESRYGCVLVGFDDGWGQGGCNTQGLAFDWVAGYKERWERPPVARIAKGNSSQRMLETCSTVEEAVAFYERYWEEAFAYGKLLVADRRGKSVLLGAKDGRLVAPIVTCSQGIGHRFDLRGNEAEALLGGVSLPSVPDAVRILKATLQDGPNATKYSLVYNLKSCEILLFRFPEQCEAVRLSLADELKKGPHYFDMPMIGKQVHQELRPLTENMKRN